MVSCLICAVLSILMASVRAAVSKDRLAGHFKEIYRSRPLPYSGVCGYTLVDLTGLRASSSYSRTFAFSLYSGHQFSAKTIKPVALEMRLPRDRLSATPRATPHNPPPLVPRIFSTAN